jgi:hypothetical protein
MRSRLLARSLLVFAALAPLAASGCDDAAIASTAKKVVCDLSTLPFTCERTVSDDFEGTTVVHTERVRSAGDGKNIVVELLTRNGKSRSQINDVDELSAFDRLAAQLASGGGRRALFQRDPGPDDLDRMLANYYVTAVQLAPWAISKRPVSGLTYLVEPMYDDRPYYLLTVATRKGYEGFPIDCQEFVNLQDGPHLVSQTTVTNVQFEAPSDVHSPESPVVSRTALATIDDARTAAGQIGLTLLLPRDAALPPGFELVTCEQVQYRTQANSANEIREVTLFRFVYSDGVEHLDLIEQTPLDTLPPNYATMPSGDVAFVTRIGTIQSALLLHRGTQVTIESRIAAARFVPIMKSLVPL